MTSQSPPFERVGPKQRCLVEADAAEMATVLTVEGVGDVAVQVGNLQAS